MHEVQLVAITFDDGSVGIMQFILDPNLPDGASIPGWDGQSREASDEAIQHEIDKSVWLSRPVSWRRMDSAELPTDRTFRNAWEDSGKVGVNMTKARGIHRDNLREMRAPKLAELDVADLRAAEEGLLSTTPNVNLAKRKAIAAQKQALRDVTDDPRIEAATTPEELKAVIPDALKG